MYGEPPGLEHSVKKAKQRPLEMSDLFQQRDEEIEDSSNMEKEYFQITCSVSLSKSGVET